MYNNVKAKEVIDTMNSLKGKGGIDTFFELKEDFVKVLIQDHGKTVLTHKIDMSKLTEQNHDELSYMLMSSLGL